MLKGSPIGFPWAAWLQWLLLLLVAPCLARLPVDSVDTREPPPPVPVSRQTPVEGWVRVKLNHFMPSDTRTFLMRFYYNDEFPGPHIVINVGGEWMVSSGWTIGGLPYEIAKQLKAGLFYSEHRYYGLTRPFNNTDLSNLRYLMVDQALADLAQFIKYIKSDAFERGRYKSGKVVLVGCSYGGTMVSFMRMAYPHLVDAAYSDSAPVQAQEDFPEYMEVVATVIRELGGEACYSGIEEAMKQVVDLLKIEGGLAQLSKIFKICTPNLTSMDLNSFFVAVQYYFKYLVQYAKTSIFIQASCAMLTNPNITSPVQRLADWFWMMSKNYDEPCIEVNYTQEVVDYRNTSYDSEGYKWRLWMYQCCVEFGWFQSTSSTRQPFLNTVPLEYYRQLCKDYFSAEFNEERLHHGIQRTNTLFGGLYHRPDHVISVSGSYDPWSPMAPNAIHAHQKSPVYVVPRESHCQAFKNPKNDDSEELTAARRAVLNFMHENVGPIPLSGATNMRATLVLLVAARVGLF